MAHLIDVLRVLVHLVIHIPSVFVLAYKPNDAIVSATTLRTRADCIVNRDDDLLSFQQYQGMTSLTLEAFIVTLCAEKYDLTQAT